MRLTDQNGKPILLSRRFAGGGEADLYSVQGDATSVAKIYKADSPGRQIKLHAMVSEPPTDPTGNEGHVSICWPRALLFDQTKHFVGFLMPLVDLSTNVPMLRVCNPFDRQQVAPGFTWGYLLTTALNMASVVEAIHARGYVIGDLNESNFLVSDRALVTLIDCDSMQVPNGRGGVFRCTVGKADFTAPELQHCTFGDVDRNTAHDNFALGVMIVQLLMEGIHPYAGLWHGQGEPPMLAERIRRGYSPYAGTSIVSPMPAALPFEFLPSTLKSLVTRCFGDGHNNPGSRPSPREWRINLTAVERNLGTCSSNPQHVYSNHLPRCPWCERDLLFRVGAKSASVGSQRTMPSAWFSVSGSTYAPTPPPPPPPTPAPRPAYPRTPSAQAPSGGGTGASNLNLLLAGMKVFGDLVRMIPIPFVIIPCVVLGVIGISMLAWLAGGITNIPLTRSALELGAAPRQFVDRGVCPFEGCKYGERWIAKRNVDVYEAPPNAVGVPVSSLKKQTLVPAGTWVHTTTGVVIASRIEGHVQMRPLPTTYASPYGLNGKKGPPLTNVSVLPLYSSLGEGCWRSWVIVDFFVVCNVASSDKVQNEWWIQIEMPDGSRPWTNSAEKAFVSDEQLNNELAQKITDDKVAMPEKLAQIGTLLRGGADLNGSGGKYGTDPMRAVIETNDVELLGTLISKGLNIRKTDPCPAYYAAGGSALRPGGDAMLASLLENGMQLGCLREPPLHSFLRFGIATASYPVDQAIRVAEVLVRHGANVNQRDSQGESIISVLDHTTEPSRLSALKEALMSLALPQRVHAGH